MTENPIRISDPVLNLVACLSDRSTRSGEDIAAELGCSRAAVWKHIKTLQGLGIGIEAVPGQGYQLQSPLELLEPEKIRAFVAATSLKHLEVLASASSTNDVLMQRPAQARHGIAVLAEYQSGGRGRRGRTWQSPFGRNLYLSLGWEFDSGVGALSCLPLVVAIAVAEALQESGLEQALIKWPNDLMHQGKKLGGCLVEISGDMNGPCQAVMGVGININMQGAPQADEIDQPWTDLVSHISDVSRNEVAGRVIDSMLRCLERFSSEGFSPFQTRWRAMDCLHGQTVRLVQGTAPISGVCTGISEQGGLLLQVEGATREFQAGEVTSWSPNRSG